MNRIIHTKTKHIIYSINTKVIITSLIASLVAPSFLPGYPASALTYETGTNVQFTFNPALSLSVSGDLLISDLSPNTASDSNIIIVNIKTNNISGYNLYATTGNTTYNTTELTNTTFATSSAPKFTSLNTTDSIDTLSNFSPNTWGYSYSNNDGTTWTSYSGLPLYTNAGTVISSSTAAAEDTTKFKIAASAAATQTAGDYQNVVNFYAVTNKAPVSFFDAFASAGKEMYNGYYKMQDMTSNICEAVEIIGNDGATDLIDIRDNEVYKVSKLKDNRCWMLDNLRLGSEKPILLTNNDTDIQSQWTLPASIEVLIYNYTHEIITSTNKNESVINYGIGSGKRGTCYNYCAVSAGTFCYDSRDVGAVDQSNWSVCPKNWKIPTSGFTSEYETLINSYNGNYSLIRQNLSLTLSGFNESSYVNVYGDYWSSTYYKRDGYTGYMYRLSFSDSSITPFNAYARNLALPIRCLTR